MLDADIRDFFTRLDQGWLEKFLEHRIADKRVLRLIQKWLRAGVIEDGEWSESLEGTAQGASVSPLLSNVYLHYVFDLWADQWRRRHARGDVILTRFADDYVAGFEHREDAERFLADLRDRFAKFGLELHPEKTRLIEFGRYAAENRARRGDRKPETFEFLGLHAHLREDPERAVQAQADHEQEEDAGKAERRSRPRSGGAGITRSPNRDAGLPASWPGITATTRCPTTSGRCKRSAKRSSGSGSRRYGVAASGPRMSWERMRRFADRWLPTARIHHPWPTTRFDARTLGRSPVR